VKLPWSRVASPASVAVPPGAVDAAPGVQTCPSLQRALDRALKLDKPKILDLGPLCGDTAVYLATQGARISVEELQPPPAPVVADGKDDEEPVLDPIKLDQPDAGYDLVLAWEQFDFTPPQRVGELAAEITRVLAPGGWLLVFASNVRGAENPRYDRPARFRVVAQNRIVRVETEGARRPRWTHPNRDLERALAPLSVQGIHLQRNQTREVLAVKRDK